MSSAAAAGLTARDTADTELTGGHAPVAACGRSYEANIARRFPATARTSLSRSGVDCM